MSHLPDDIPFSFYYQEPQHPLIERWINIKSQHVNATPIIRSMLDTCNLIMTDIQKNDLKNPEHYQWNMYTHLGIPLLSHIFRNFNKEQDNLFYFLLNQIPNNLHFPGCTFLIKKAQTENLFLIINNTEDPIPNESSHYAYKIHLVCKPEYILYAFFKLLELRNLFLVGKKYKIVTKVNLDSRAHLPREDDTILISDEVNGGASPSIVIYVGENRDVAIAFILAVMNLFKDDAEIIGGMERIDSPFFIPAFNVRINSLIAYASGDRATRLDLRMANMGKKEYNANYPKGTFKTPDWVKAYRESCTKETMEEINKKSMNMFGHPLCAHDGTPGPDPVPCGICYMTSARQEPMISPFDLYAAAGAAPAAAGVAPAAAGAAHVEAGAAHVEAGVAPAAAGAAHVEAGVAPAAAGAAHVEAEAAPARAACGGAGCLSPRRGGSRRPKRRKSRRTMRHKKYRLFPDLSTPSLGVLNRK